jgi:flagellar biosynthetic protein FlhB
VALKYDQQKMKAPEIVAMGADYVAERIRTLARESGVAIVENRPLARALYQTAEVGRAVPIDLYQAVAEVLAFVYRLKRRRA